MNHQLLSKRLRKAASCRRLMITRDRRRGVLLLVSRYAASSTAATSPSSPSAVSSARPSSASSAAARSEATANNAGSSSSTSWKTTAAIAALSLGVGYALGSSSQHRQSNHDGVAQNRVLPDGLPRTCCEHSDDHHLTDQQKELPEVLAKIVGKENVLDGRQDPSSSLLRPFLKGARLGGGAALAVVTPRRLVDVVDCVQAAVDAGCVILPQGRNTGLTGGSVPRSNGDGGGGNSSGQKRPTVVLSTKYLDRIFPIDGGRRVVCLAGAGLASLSQFLERHFPHRESHSQLGSTFLDPTTSAGVAFGSGGTQLRKGPAYTERALYLKVGANKWNENVIEVVNTLGIDGMEDKDLPEGRARKHMDSAAYRLDTWSRWVENEYVRDMRYSSTRDPNGGKPASYPGYADHVCRRDSNVSRYNADTSGPECNRSEGKVVILATVHDTFPKPKRTKSYWISFDTLETALAFRREVCLDNPKDLPVSLEYLNRDAYDIIDRSGRFMAMTIRWLGTSSTLIKRLWGLKLRIESLPFEGAPLFADKVLHSLNPFVPSVLPSDVVKTAKTMDHHVAMTVADFDDDEEEGSSIDRLLNRLQQFATKHGKSKIVIHDCSSSLPALTAFRFVAATAFRTWCVGEGAQGISVDYALPKNAGEEPPIDPEKSATPLRRMRYSHFGCNVVHEDLAYAATEDAHKAKYDFKKIVEFQCNGKLPAEHGHGTEYVGPKETQDRWKKMDPLNVLNPGIGGLSDKPKYVD